MESELDAPRGTPQTDQFLFWGVFLVLLAAAFLMVVSLREDRARLAGLQRIEAGKQAELAEADAAVAKGHAVLRRFTDDDEFVRDQARERLGVAAPDEVVIRLEPGAGGAASPAPARPGASLFNPAENAGER
jgi:cell division protein FtsB